MLQPYIESATTLPHYYLIDDEETQEFMGFVGRQKWTSTA